MRAFVIRPFGTKTDSDGMSIDFDKVHEKLIAPALQAADVSGSTVGQIIQSGILREDMFELMLEADLVVCDVSMPNANVFYELGIRHALRKKRTLLIRGEPTSDHLAFDLLSNRYLTYAIDDPAAAKDKLIEMIRASLSTEGVDSPIFQWLPSLPEADPSNVRVVPRDFREEVERACQAKAKGWLRLLAEEVRGLRFGVDGLKTVAASQWSVKDYDGARESWETIRESYPTDIAANLALASIYERLYRSADPGDTAVLEKSNQAIARVLDNASAGRADRAEALALRGRNLQTRWRLEFEHLRHVEERRAAAVNRPLIESYECYRDAFREDLNAFYPGLSALRLGTIILALSEDESWAEVFDSDREADAYRARLEHELSSLRQTVPSSIEAGMRRMDEGDPDFLWARISSADVLFLASDG